MSVRSALCIQRLRAAADEVIDQHYDARKQRRLATEWRLRVDVARYAEGAMVLHTGEGIEMFSLRVVSGRSPIIMLKRSKV